MSQASAASQEIQRLPVARIAEQCAAATRRFFRSGDGDDRWCFELFRRAICEGVEEAWGHLLDTYQPEMAGWVRACPGFRAEWEVDDFVQDAFRRFVGAVDARKFVNFATLAHLLAYLKSCVFGAVTDEARKAQRQELTDVPLHLPDADAGTEQQALDGEMAQAFWRLLQARFKSEAERIVVEEMFLYGQKPRHLAARFPTHFASPADASQVKRNVLDRLQRDPALRRLWADWQN